MTAHVLVVVEPGEEAFDEAALAAIAAGQVVAGATDRVSVLVLGGARRIEPVSWDVAEVVHARAAEPLDGLAAQRIVWRHLEESGATLVLAPHKGIALDFAAAVAAERELGFAANVLSVDTTGGVRVVRSRYGGKVVETLGLPDSRPAVVTLREGAMPAASIAVREDVLVPTGYSVEDEVVTRRTGITPPAAGGVDITKADVILAIGRGVGDESNVERFVRLADRMGATLAASRPLVDVGWIEPARQVGQSGRTVKPKVYLALGISGSIQHVAGMRGSGTVIAVNKDREAPIFEIASFGAVMDILELADALEAEYASV